jgi:hypothetical protein
MKTNTVIAALLLVASSAIIGTSCATRTPDLATKTYEQDGRKFIVQKMPADFNDGENESQTGLKYYRLIIQAPGRFTDTSDVNYINFGMEHSVKMVRQQDSISPAFMQRIANGKEETYEYIVAFADNTKPGTPFDICLRDHVLGLGTVSVKF